MINEIVELSKKLIEIPSIKGNSEALNSVCDLAVSYLPGFTVEKFNQNNVPSVLVYKGEVRPKRFKVLFNAHLDVVPANSEQFKPEIKDGKLYGRGAYDMKAAGAAELMVFRKMATQVDYPLGLQLVADEEIGGFDGVLHQIKEGVLADFVLAGEPTDFNVNNQAKGIIWLKIKTKGVSAHGAYPWRGENAIWKMNSFLNKLSEIFPTPKVESWVTSVNVAKVTNSNQAFNTVPDDCEISLDIRYIPEDKDKVLEKIQSILPEKSSYEIIMNEPCQFTDQSNEYIQKLRKTTDEVVSGFHSQVIVKHGGADIRHYNAIGCEGVTFGPKGAGLHTDDEWVEIESLRQYALILEKFLSV